MISSSLAAIIVGVLVVIILLTTAWGLYEYHNVTSKEASILKNPFCLRKVCTKDGSTNNVYTFNTKDDPQRYAFEKMNYCVVNAPPCALIDKITKCSDKISKDEVSTLSKWYHTTYFPVCKYRWGGGIKANTQGTDGPDPNSTDLRCGPNDPFLVALHTCAKTKKVDQKLINDLEDDLNSGGINCKQT